MALTYEQISRMVGKARGRHADATYCGDKKDWPSCFTVEEGQVFLWYNDATGGTHVITEPMELDLYGIPVPSEEHASDCTCEDCRDDNWLKDLERRADARRGN